MTTLISHKTKALLDQTILWDNHACMPLRPGDVSVLPQLERVRRAGIDLVSLNVTFDVIDPNEAFPMLATYRRWIQEDPRHYLLAETVGDIERAKGEGKLAVVFDIEGGNAVTAHPGLVEIFYRLGVRWMLFAYNKNNKLGGGCMDDDTGLTAYGRQIIKEMERVGMVLCCAHTGHRTVREAIEYSSQPVIFSHSNPSAVYPHVRNIPDDLMRMCAATGGVVNINGVGIFLGKDASGKPDNRTETIVRHIAYAVNLIGPEHVGLGLDYVFDVAELEDHVRKNPLAFPAEVREPGSYSQVEPERFPVIAEALLSKGYSETDVQGILGHNNLRVARQVWKSL
jgi:membrane dipeptidase